MSRLIKTQDPNYVKDEKSGVFINTNDEAYKNILIARKQKKEINYLNNELDNLRNDIEQLKLLIKGKI